MILKKLTVDHPDFPAVEKLYEASFPIEERHSTMAQLVEASEQLPGDSSLEVLGIYLDEGPDDFVGFFPSQTVGSSRSFSSSRPFRKSARAASAARRSRSS